MAPNQKGKPFKCDVCPSNFIERSVLKSHMASLHEVKRPFKCDFCHSNFIKKGALKIILHQFMSEKNSMCILTFKGFKFYRKS